MTRARMNRSFLNYCKRVYLPAALLAVASGCRDPHHAGSYGVSATLPTSSSPAPTVTNATRSSPDPYLWLEDVSGEKSLAWVRQQNALSVRELEAAPEFNTNRQRLLAILNSKERIPGI